MEFLGTHRGAGLFKVINDSDNVSEKNTLRKVRAEGVYSDKKNQKIEFFAEGETWKEAAKKLLPQIDKYLDDRNWDKFDFDLLE